MSLIHLDIFIRPIELWGAHGDQDSFVEHILSFNHVGSWTESGCRTFIQHLYLWGLFPAPFSFLLFLNLLSGQGRQMSQGKFPVFQLGVLLEEATYILSGMLRKVTVKNPSWFPLQTEYISLCLS